MKSSSRSFKKGGAAAKAQVVIGEEHFINRELAWLAFNERVLEEAERASLPLLERAKFVAITAANLDEFFMVRVGALQLLRDQLRRVRDASGLTPIQQWEQIAERVQAFLVRTYRLLDEDLLPALRKAGIRRLGVGDLTPGQRTYLEGVFRESVYPVLSPVAIDLDQVEGVLLPTLQITLLCEVETEAEEAGGQAEKRLVMVTLPGKLSRHLLVPDVEGARHAYINLEDLVELFLGHLFPDERVTAVARFRVSRNSDIAVDDESAFDLASEMEQVLDARLVSAAIRLEIEQGAPKGLIAVLKKLCGARAAQVYEVPGELDLRAYFGIAELPGFDELKVETWQSYPSADIEPGEGIFGAIRRGDILMHHPFENFEPVLNLVEAAATERTLLRWRR
jgi:polyphosphate kinase